MKEKGSTLDVQYAFLINFRSLKTGNHDFLHTIRIEWSLLSLMALIVICLIR